VIYGSIESDNLAPGPANATNKLTNVFLFSCKIH